MLQVKVSHPLGALGANQYHTESVFVLQGKGDMVTYWLEGKKTPLVSKDVGADAKMIKKELCSSLPESLNQELLLDPE